MRQRQPDALRHAILSWYDSRARALPWRGERDPYRIWISEIMLQQTRAEAVTPYYRAFLEEFPDVFALAAADQQRVLKRWEGLGYYSRARNLHSAAQIVAREREGLFPLDAKSLAKLPGIGEYTAGMVASIAYSEPSPAIDGNQIRVLSRLFEVEEPARSKPGMALIRARALELIDADRPGDFNQALMDIGAEICKPRAPRCGDCPARTFCLAARSGNPERMPVLPERPTKRVERRGVLVVVCAGSVLVRRREEHGLLGGLWEFPNFTDATTRDAALACLAELGIDAKYICALSEVEHVFTHLIWRQKGMLFSAKAAPDIGGCRWVDAAGLRELPMPTAMKIYREEAAKSL